jgi:hypothetical protein
MKNIFVSVSTATSGKAVVFCFIVVAAVYTNADRVNKTDNQGQKDVLKVIAASDQKIVEVNETYLLFR